MRDPAQDLLRRGILDQHRAKNESFGGITVSNKIEREPVEVTTMGSSNVSDSQRRGDEMKKNLFTTPEPEEPVTIAKDVDADDPEASDLLDVIGRETSVEEPSEELMKKVSRTAVSGGPFLLESLYFRSFGERALLTREEEVELAKKIDRGTSTIRKALRHAIRAFSRLKRSDSVVESHRTLQMVRGLSGLSASAIDKAEQSLTGMIEQRSGQQKLPMTIAKQLKEGLATLRGARIVLERAKDELVRCNLRLVGRIVCNDCGADRRTDFA